MTITNDEGKYGNFYKNIRISSVSNQTNSHNEDDNYKNQIPKIKTGAGMKIVRKNIHNNEKNLPRNKKMSSSVSEAKNSILSFDNSINKVNNAPKAEQLSSRVKDIPNSKVLSNGPSSFKVNLNKTYEHQTINVFYKKPLDRSFKIAEGKCCIYNIFL